MYLYCNVPSQSAERGPVQLLIFYVTCCTYEITTKNLEICNTYRSKSTQDMLDVQYIVWYKQQTQKIEVLCAPKELRKVWPYFSTIQNSLNFIFNIGMSETKGFIESHIVFDVARVNFHYKPYVLILIYRKQYSNISSD